LEERADFDRSLWMRRRQEERERKGSLMRG
jgi:hypothetical protein